MQLITATLSPIAVSCAIGSTSSKELWIRLKEQFSTVSRTSIFQMKSNLQTIKKGSDSVAQYLHRIKEARDYLSAAGVYFADEDIVILALNDLPAEYNTFRCVIWGRESVISLKDFRSQLLAEEIIIDTSVNSPFLSAMVASTGDTYTQGSFSPNHGQSQVHTRQFQSYNGNRNRSKGRFPQGSRFFGPKPGFSSMAPMFPNSNSGVLGQSPAQPFRHPSALMVPICQLCNSEGHTAPFCGASPPKRTRCNICGRSNHPSWYCFYNDKGPNYMASYSLQSSFSMQPQPLQYTPYQASPS
nr:uncharacterized protein LOC118061423 isoform X1 [Populus alba]